MQQIRSITQVTVVDPLEYQESLMTGIRKELNAITQNFQPSNQPIQQSTLLEKRLPIYSRYHW
jgi:hypothetical protein